MNRKVMLYVNGVQVATGTVPQDYLEGTTSLTSIRLHPDSMAIEQGFLRASTVLQVDLQKVS